MPNVIHETILKDIVDLIGDARDFAETDSKKILGNDKHTYKSLTKAANNLILVFPVLCTKGISIETASMISKAIEKYCVNLLHMVLASVQITNTDNLQDYISRFHSNISIGDKITVDDFVSFTDTVFEAVDAGVLRVTDRAVFEQFKEGMSKINDYIKTTLNENCLSDFECHKSYANGKVILEVIKTAGDGFKMTEEIDSKEHKLREKRKADKMVSDWKKGREKQRINKSTDIYTRSVEERNRFIDKLVEDDMKKANELMPTPVIVDFYSSEAGTRFERGIIGVKCKLYAVDSMEIIERVATKYADSNWVRELVRASTGEISFWRDFVFALDKARIDAINSNRKSSSAKMWKVLERRATKNRLSKWKSNRADSSPITTLIVSQDEVEYLKKEYDIDLENRKIANKLMESYNFMGLFIADEASESVSFIWDEGNDAMYETLSFRNLERESSDRDYKKVISLMTKISR